MTFSAPARVLGAKEPSDKVVLVLQDFVYVGALRVPVATQSLTFDRECDGEACSHTFMVMPHQERGGIASEAIDLAGAPEGIAVSVRQYVAAVQEAGRMEYD